MKRINILSILILLISVNVQAQSDINIQTIRKRYYEVKKEIKYSEKNKEEGSLYCDILERNVNGASWQAVGTFHLKQKFWYKSQDDFPDNPNSGLEMVIVNCERAAAKFYSEYLFHEGKLIFVFYKNENEELRYYFKNNKLIKQLGEYKENMYMLSADEALKNSKIYIKQYMSVFCAEN